MRAERREEGRGSAGVFRRHFRGAAALWIWSAVLALLCTMISYPGIWYSDSYVRAATGGAVLNAVVKTLTGHRFLLETHNAFTVIPSFFMAASIGVTGHVALYTFCQAFAFFAAVFLLIRELNPPGKPLPYLLFALSPLVYGASVYWEANVGSFAGLIALILLLRRAGVTRTRGEKAAAFALCALASLVTFGYRTNALTVLPVLAVWFFRTQRERGRRVMGALALACGLALVWLLPWAFGVRSLSNGATGFLWEILTTVQRMDGEDRAAWEDCLDEVGGEGATAEALRTSTETSANDFMWGGALNAEKLSAPGAMGKTLGVYFRLIREKPAEWLRVKADLTLRALGIGQTLDDSEYNYNRWEMMGEYGFNDSAQRKAFHASYLNAGEALGFYVRHPWAVFLVTLAMVLAETLRKSPKRGLYAGLLWTAVFFYGAYLAVNVGFELRFFYPALILMLAVDLSITLEWVKAGADRIRRRAGGAVPRGKERGRKRT